MEKQLVKLITIILKFVKEYFWETGSGPPIHKIIILSIEILNGTNK